MKKLLVAIVAVLVSAASYAQGTLNVSNLQPGQEIWIEGQENVAGPGAAGSAQLYLGGTAVGTVISFFPDTGATHWLIPTDITVESAAAGSTATFVLRVWETEAGSYDAAAGSTTWFFGESAPFDVNLGGQLASGVTLPPGDTAALQSFTVAVVPEPSTIALGVIGAAALLLRRRRK